MTATTTLTLTAFLLQRIEDDEAVAQSAYPGPWRADADGQVWTPQHEEDGPTVYVNGGVYRNQRNTAAHIARHDPARVLAECEAKRAVVRMAELYADAQFPDFDGGYVTAADRAVAHLAAVYASHPDCDESWRP